MKKRYEIKKQFRKEVLAKAVSIEQWEKQFQSDCKDKETISQSFISKEIAGDYRTKLAWHVQNKTWYWYEFIFNGVWSEVPEEEVNAIIIAEVEKRTKHFRFDFVSSITRFLKAELRTNHWEVRPGFICLSDCVLDVNTKQVYSHEPGYRFLSSLPYKWSDRDTGCEPIKNWLLSVCEGRSEWVQVLRAAMKATVTEQGGNVQRFMELVGFGGTGKSTILSLVSELVGEENTAVTDLKQLESNRFETASFYGKKLVLITDSERYVGDVSTLKKLTGDDTIRCEKKGIQQTGGFKFHGMVWVGANSAIQSSDYTSGLRRRRLSMGFERVVPPHLRRDLKTEFKPYLSGLLDWVLGMSEQEMFDYVRNTDAMVPSLATFNNQTLLNTNPFAEWIDDCLVIDPSAKTYIGTVSMNPESYLFANYCNWAAGQKGEAARQKRFSADVLDLLKSTLGLSESVKGKDRRGAYLTGVAIRQFNDYSSPRPISGEIKCDGLGDGSVTGNVTGQSIASDGLQECDVSLSGKAIQTTLNFSEQNNESSPSEFATNSLHPSHSSPTSDTATTQTITNSEQTQTNPSQTPKLLLKMIEVWTDSVALGEVVLAATPEELRAAIITCTPSQLSDIKNAANYVWRPGFNRDADYLGERFEIMEAGQVRDMSIRSRNGGSVIKVKRGNLRPWLDI